VHRIDLAATEQLSDEDLSALAELRRNCAGDIVRMTNLATCGHPGGSLSSLDFLLCVYASAALSGSAPRAPERDRVILSIGHISPATYSVLAAYGFCDRRDALLGFRLAGSPFSGHVEFGVPGVEWNTGNLGQGLSAGCAAALAAKLQGRDSRAIVVMGDGEQQKGQISEARRFATKFGLSNLIAFVDLNGLQIGGDTQKVMPQAIAEEYRCAGWNVIELDGHDPAGLYSAFRSAYLASTEQPERPTALIAKTVMGKGISFMEGDCHFHGVVPNDEQVKIALAELGLEDDMAELRSARAALGYLVPRQEEPQAEAPSLDLGDPRTYEPGSKVDCRGGYGNALADLAALNNADGAGKIAAISCDLEGSVRMQGFHKNSPKQFIETGIQEHHAATLAGFLSWEGYVPFLSTFGVFAVGEGYNQQRLNDINRSNVKLVATHCGLDVGEDGPTHQSIDWLALMQGPFHFHILSPADANECDRMVRWAAGHRGNVFIAMGRSKIPTIAATDGSAQFGGETRFEPGKATWIREGSAGTLAVFGPTVAPALEARELLAAEGIEVGVLSFGSLKPIDEDAIKRAAAIGPVLSVEDHNVNCGLGALIAQTLGAAGLVGKLARLGAAMYGSSGTPAALFEEQGMHPAGIAQSMRELIG